MEGGKADKRNRSKKIRPRNEKARRDNKPRRERRPRAFKERREQNERKANMDEQQ